MFNGLLNGCCILVTANSITGLTIANHHEGFAPVGGMYCVNVEAATGWIAITELKGLMVSRTREPGCAATVPIFEPSSATIGIRIQRELSAAVCATAESERDLILWAGSSQELPHEPFTQ